MDKTLYVTFLLCVPAYYSVLGKFQSSSEESNLVSYIKSVLTVYSPHQDLANDSVYPTLDLFQVISLDENLEEITIKYSLSYYYYVTSLQWNPDEYNGVTKMTFPSGTFWCPDIANEDIIEDVYSSGNSQLVFSSGKVVCSHKLVVLIYACTMEYALFPFDQQSCPITLTAHGSSEGQYSLALDPTYDPKTGAKLRHYTPNAQWKLKTPLEFKIESVPMDHDDHGDAYQTLIVDIQLERDPVFFLSIIIFPSFGIYILSSFVFVLPVQSGEKITFASANLLAQVLTLGTEVAANLPRNSEHFPVFGNYMAFMIVQMASSLIFTIFAYNFYFIGNNGRKIPSWLNEILRDERLKYLFMPPVKTSGCGAPDVQPSSNQPETGEYQRMDDLGENNAGMCVHLAMPGIEPDIDQGTMQTNRIRDLTMLNVLKCRNNLAPMWARASVLFDRVCFGLFLTIALIVTCSYFFSVLVVRSP